MQLFASNYEFVTIPKVTITPLWVLIGEVAVQACMFCAVWGCTKVTLCKIYPMRKITYSYSRGASKQDEALECYGRAANMYKMAKKWSAAGNTFCTIANHHVKVGNVSISNLELGLPKSSVLYIAHLISKIILSLETSTTQPPTMWTLPTATRRTTPRRLPPAFRRSCNIFMKNTGWFS